MTNNMAEYQALLHGLKAFRHDVDHGYLHRNGIFESAINLTMLSDSKLLVEQLCGRWRVKVRHIKELEQECMSLLRGFGHWNVRWNSRSKNVERFGH